MTLQEQHEQFEAFVEKQRNIMLKKGNDYANEDRLSNFKLVAKIVGISVEQVINVFLATKVVRLCNLTSSSKKPENESIEDNVLDLANYGQLFEMVRKESETSKRCCGNWDDNGVCKCNNI